MMLGSGNGVGPIGSTCAGCIHGPWKDDRRPDIDAAAMRVCYGDLETWFCGLTSAQIAREQRGCGSYQARNGQVTFPMFPSTAFKPGSVAPADVGTVLLLLKAERD